MQLKAVHSEDELDCHQLAECHPLCFLDMCIGSGDHDGGVHVHTGNAMALLKPFVVVDVNVNVIVGGTGILGCGTTDW